MKFITVLLFYFFSQLALGQETVDVKRLCAATTFKERNCRQISPAEKLGLQSLQMQCEVSFDKKACEELAKKIPHDAKDKIKSCDSDQICKGQTASAATSCVIGGVTFAWDTVVGIVTAPYEMMQFISDSFAKDQACFENQKGTKEALIKAYDALIIEEHKQFRISPEIKNAMMKYWPCREIQNHLMVKTKNYQAFLGPLIAQGKYNPSADPAPLAKLIDAIRGELGVRWDCYTPAARAEMNCYILSSALTAGVGSAFSLRAKLGKFGVAEESIARAESVAQKNYLNLQVGGKKPKNPQVAVWNARKEGNPAKAEALEAQLVKDLDTGKVVGQPTSAGSGANGAQIVKLDTNVDGVWKPNEVRDKSGKVVSETGAKNEVAAFVVDRILGADAVPVTVEKTLNGQSGSLQLRVENAQPNPAGKRKLAFYDDLISHADRHADNILSSEGRLTAIDNGATFTDPNFPKEFTFRGQVEINLEGYKNAITAEQKKIYFDRLQSFMPEKEVYERLVSTKTDEWKKALSPHLTIEKIKTFIDKRNKIIDVVESARKEIGDGIFAPKQ